MTTPCPHPPDAIQPWGYSGEIEWCQRCGAIRGMGVDWMSPEPEPAPEVIQVEAVVVPDAPEGTAEPAKTEQPPSVKPPSRTPEEAEEAQLLLRKSLRCDVRKGSLHYSMQLADIFHAKRDEKWTKDEVEDFKAEMAWSLGFLTKEEKDVVTSTIAGYTVKQRGQR